MEEISEEHKVHNLKVDLEIFQQMEKGIRQFDIRKSDRDFQIGDTLLLHEYDFNKKMFKSGWLPRRIVCKSYDSHLKEGYVILGLQEISFEVIK